MTTKYVNTSELAEYFGIAKATVLSMMRSGEIPAGTYMRAGRVFRFDLKAIEEHLLTNATPTGDVDGSAETSELPYQLKMDLGEEADTEENLYHE